MLSLPKGMNEYYGRIPDKMPKLLEAGEVPISVSGIMQSRLRQGNEFPDLWNEWYDTSDLAVYPEDNYKELYVFLTVDNQGQMTENGRKALELIRPDNLTLNYSAVVEQLKDLGKKGLIKVPRSKIKYKISLSKDQILNEQVWRILARHPDEVPAEFAEDKKLLEEYVNEVQKRSETTYRNMSLYFGNSLEDETTLKNWHVSRLGYWSGALGGDVLDVYDGRLIGITQEAQELKSLEEKL